METSTLKEIFEKNKTLLYRYSVTSQNCLVCANEKDLSLFQSSRLEINGFHKVCNDCYAIHGQTKDYFKLYSEAIAIHDLKGVKDPLFELRMISQHNAALMGAKRNPETNTAYTVAYKKKRKAKDPLFKFSEAIRSNVKNAFSRRLEYKSKKTVEILGCSIVQFSKYIEDLFITGMNFENYGEWELDHIIPIASAKNKSEVLKLCHFSNYQPLWKTDNRKKAAKY